MARNKIANAFSQKRVPTSKLSNAGYDNARENIDPHVRTKVVSTQEGSIERAPTAGNHITNKTYVDAEDAAADAHITADGTSHANVVLNDTHRGSNGTNHANVVLNDTHRADNTQAHSDYLLNSGADEAVGPLTTTADNSTADQAFVPMVLYNTDAAPPAANTVPIGTIYIQYTA